MNKIPFGAFAPTSEVVKRSNDQVLLRNNHAFSDRIKALDEDGAILVYTGAAHEYPKRMARNPVIGWRKTHFDKVNWELFPDCTLECYEAASLLATEQQAMFDNSPYELRGNESYLAEFEPFQYQA
jgi:hypothetical protein